MGITREERMEIERAEQKEDEYWSQRSDGISQETKIEQLVDWFNMQIADTFGYGLLVDHLTEEFEKYLNRVDEQEVNELYSDHII